MLIFNRGTVIEWKTAVWLFCFPFLLIGAVMCRCFSSPLNIYMHICMAGSSLQFSSRWYLCTQKSQYYALHPISQKFPQRCLWNSSSVRLIDWLANSVQLFDVVFCYRDSPQMVQNFELQAAESVKWVNVLLLLYRKIAGTWCRLISFCLTSMSAVTSHFVTIIFIKKWNKHVC